MATQATETTKTGPSRRTLRTLGRKKRAERLKADPAFKKAYFEAKSKRAVDKKSAYRKKKKGKKA